MRCEHCFQFKMIPKEFCGFLTEVFVDKKPCPFRFEPGRGNRLLNLFFGDSLPRHNMNPA